MRRRVFMKVKKYMICLGIQQESSIPTYLRDFVDPSILRALIMKEDLCTIQEAINAANANHWKETMKEKIMALHKNRI